MNKLVTKKSVVVLCALAMILTVCVGAVYAANGGFSRPENVMMDVKISGSTFGSKMYLGFTWMTPSGEIDKEVVKVKGNFTKRYTVPLMRIDKNNMSCDYVSRLWNKKVPKRKCKRGPCRWCNINGYHMEGPGSSVSGTWSI